MMKRLSSILLCFLTILVIGCTIDSITEIVTEIINEEPEEPAPVVEENKPEDLTMDLKPIKQFDNYVVSPHLVLGIDGVSLETVDVFDTDDNEYSFKEFFKIGNDVFFKIANMETGEPIPDTDPVQYETVEVIHYFKQKVKVLTEIDKADFPTPPDSKRIEFEGGSYKIFPFLYENKGEETLTSRVSFTPPPDPNIEIQGVPVVGYLQIDGCSLTQGGLWFSVSETIKTRFEGVYFWSVGGSPNRVLDVGRIY